MPKRIMPDYPIYVAPRMLGRYTERGTVVVMDERNDVEINPCCLDGKILIYQRQVEGWFLEPADRLLKQMDTQASFVVLSICLSYLEAVQQHKEGEPSRNNSKAFFLRAFQDVFSSSEMEDEFAGLLYKEGRCGLFHDGMTGGQIAYDMKLDKAFKVINNGDLDIIFFHPKYCLEGVKAHFADYISKLKNEEEVTLRNKFDVMFTVTSLTFD
jgi:hypothetical protein